MAAYAYGMGIEKAQLNRLRSESFRRFEERLKRVATA